MKFRIEDSGGAKQLCELMMDRITELIEKGIDPVELINLLPRTL